MRLKSQIECLFCQEPLLLAINGTNGRFESFLECISTLEKRFRIVETQLKSFKLWRWWVHILLRKIVSNSQSIWICTQSGREYFSIHGIVWENPILLYWIRAIKLLTACVIGITFNALVWTWKWNNKVKTFSIFGLENVIFHSVWLCIKYLPNNLGD